MTHPNNWKKMDVSGKGDMEDGERKPHNSQQKKRG